jgi:hypothetical protein
MLDPVSPGVSDLRSSSNFDDAVLGALGVVRKGPLAMAYRVASTAWRSFLRKP